MTRLNARIEVNISNRVTMPIYRALRAYGPAIVPLVSNALSSVCRQPLLETNGT